VTAAIIVECGYMMWNIGFMTAAQSSVGLRELRHHTSEVLARVRRGETVEVTDRGQLVARIVPVTAGPSSPTLARLAASGRATLARRTGPRPRILPGDGTNKLSEALQALRDEERW
jgi:prevent-host-death family protein